MEGRGTSGWVNALNDRIARHKHDNLQMIVCILPGQNKVTYDTIKRICLVDHGISSQVVTGKILSDFKKQVAVVGKVAIQINCKLGGEAWGVDICLQNMMVIGIDLHKNTQDKSKHVASFVSSMNGFVSKTDTPFCCTKYYSRCRMQEKKNIGIDCLYEFMTGTFVFFIYLYFEALKKRFYKNKKKDGLYKYHEKNGRKPERIIIYRDGVGEGDLNILMDIERLFVF